jgi:bacterial translation initiation factor 3 (bIF-3)
MKPKIEKHDFQFKLRNALRFLEDGDKVKVGVRFMGRQIAHKDLGVELLERFQAEIGDDGTVEQPISSEGRSMHMILAPPKKRSRNDMKMKTHRGAAKRFKKTGGRRLQAETSFFTPRYA